jgi:hypothetical protein
MIVKPQEVQIAQDRELPVQTGRNAGFAWRYAYARSSDSREAGDPGQDYLLFRYDDTRLVFALCDGVSQSFFGEIAAYFLGNKLVRWLWQGLPPGMSATELASAISTLLDNLTSPATEFVRAYPLPKNIPPMLNDVLEGKRALGSETTFICGEIALPADGLPEGRALLAWMGDSRLRLWGEAGERTHELGGTFQMWERWSTHRGIVMGTPHVALMPVQQGGRRALTHLLAYSDGAAGLDPLTHSPSNSALRDIISRAGESSVSDDIALLEVWLDGGAPDTGV